MDNIYGANEQHQKISNAQSSSPVVLIDKTVWGPKFWFVIHTYALSYPEEPSDFDKYIALTFIKILPFILPCGECGIHAFSYLKENSWQFDTAVHSGKNLKRFFSTFHNSVNQRLGKPLYNLSNYD